MQGWKQGLHSLRQLKMSSSSGSSLSSLISRLPSFFDRFSFVFPYIDATLLHFTLLLAPSEQYQCSTALQIFLIQPHFSTIIKSTNTSFCTHLQQPIQVHPALEILLQSLLILRPILLNSVTLQVVRGLLVLGPLQLFYGQSPPLTVVLLVLQHLYLCVLGAVGLGGWTVTLEGIFVLAFLVESEVVDSDGVRFGTALQELTYVLHLQDPQSIRRLFAGFSKALVRFLCDDTVQKSEYLLLLRGLRLVSPPRLPPLRHFLALLRILFLMQQVNIPFDLSPKIVRAVLEPMRRMFFSCHPLPWQFFSYIFLPCLCYLSVYASSREHRQNQAWLFCRLKPQSHLNDSLKIIQYIISHHSLLFPQCYRNSLEEKGKFGYVRVIPPSTTMVCPVIQLAAEEATNSAHLAISSERPILCRGITLVISLYFPILSRSNPSVPPMTPGHIPTTLIFLGPSSTAMCLVSASTPALAVPAWVCSAVPLQCRLAVMLMITPPLLNPASFTYLERRNVPTVSIISTVLKPFGVSLSKGHRKFPAAPFTSTSILP